MFAWVPGVRSVRAGGVSIVHVVSMSGGKDSTATALLALETQPRESLRFVFADTGNESDHVYSYLSYLESALSIEIVRLKRDFTEWWWRRRDYVRDVWPDKLVKPVSTKVGTRTVMVTPSVVDEFDDNGEELDEVGIEVDVFEMRPEFTREQADAIVTRVLGILEKGPTGNPYLDLCIIKGRFPSRKAQFCTQFLKTEPLIDYAMGLIDQGHAVWSWQGVRSEESPGRARAPEFEVVGGGLYNYRPIKRWTVVDVFDAHRAYGIEPNPLYKLGMARVGCMPCINASKGEIAEIARRFPEHIKRIAEWESLVGSAGKRAMISSFFPAPEDGGRADRMGRNIHEVVRWSQTTRGGRQFDLLRASEELSACSSAYGLCE